MRIDIISIFPDFFENAFDYSIVKKAMQKKLVSIKIHNLRDHTKNKQKSIDDYPFGGGAGMVMNIEPIFNCITSLKKERHYDEIIYLSPDGKTLNQEISNELSLKDNIILLCGHYKGVDHRVREHLITKEISIGDYVLTGGEMPAAILADSIIRLIPGVISDETSALTDSFQDNLLAPPTYTRPADFRGWKVPEILLSGDLKKINSWKDQESLKRTENIRPDLLD
jgi:tRNA (guanine37-N1)-methyltransferase|tara:strand:- start:2136 stop:2810 length:675 start_codon:yes stop_codon:yes gene_type:complete